MTPAAPPATAIYMTPAAPPATAIYMTPAAPPPATIPVSATTPPATAIAVTATTPSATARPPPATTAIPSCPCTKLLWLCGSLYGFLFGLHCFASWLGTLCLVGPGPWSRPLDLLRRCVGCLLGLLRNLRLCIGLGW